MNLRHEVKREESKLAQEQLEDLPVSEEQAEETKGASDSQGKLLVGTEQGLFVR